MDAEEGEESAPFEPDVPWLEVLDVEEEELKGAFPFSFYAELVLTHGFSTVAVDDILDCYKFAVDDFVSKEAVIVRSLLSAYFVLFGANSRPAAFQQGPQPAANAQSAMNEKSGVRLVEFVSFRTSLVVATRSSSSSSPSELSEKKRAEGNNNIIPFSFAALRRILQDPPICYPSSLPLRTVKPPSSRPSSPRRVPASPARPSRRRHPSPPLHLPPPLLLLLHLLLPHHRTTPARCPPPRRSTQSR